MARPIQYDSDAVTDKALALFWREGYTRSSVDMLVAATGLNKHSLYNAFEGKDGLFRRVLQRYIGQHAQPYLAILARQQGLEAIRAYLAAILKQAGRGGGRGCLLANTAVELGASDAAVRRLIDAYYRRLAQALAGAIEQAQTAGDIRADIDAAETAKWLVHVVQGLALGSRLRSSVAGDVDALLALMTTTPKARTQV